MGFFLVFQLLGTLPKSLQIHRSIKKIGKKVISNKNAKEIKELNNGDINNL